MTSAQRSDVVVGRLRRRLTLAFFAVAALGMGGLVVALLVVSSRYESTRLNDRLTAVASRTAALVYVDGEGRVRLDAIRNDTVSDGAFDIVVVAYDSSGKAEILLDPAEHGRAIIEGVVGQARTDEEEQGSTATVRDSGASMQVAAMPWYTGKRIAGAAVAIAPSATPTTSPVLPASVAGGLALLTVLTASVWALVGRGLRPAAVALEEREQFLATAAHELRAPLARLRAAAEGARRDAGPGGTTGSAGAGLRDMIAIADSAGQMVANLLLATRIEHTAVPVAREPVRLDQILANLELVYPELVVDVTEPVTLIGDPALLRHAIVNLVENAYRHGRVGDAMPTVVASVRLDDAGLRVVEVCDDGPGFPPDLDILQRHVSGSRSGTGLGLSLVSWIAEAHGAVLRTASGPPDSPGARVQLCFPPTSGHRTRTRSSAESGSGARLPG